MTPTPAVIPPPAALCTWRVFFLVAAVAAASAPMYGQTHTPQSTAESAALARALDAFAMPLSFEPVGSRSGVARPGTPGSDGHESAAARYVARGPGYTVELAPAQTSIQLPSGGKVDLHFVGSDRAAAIRGEEQLRATHSYFAFPSRAQASVPMYGRVSYKELYPGIDAAFYGRAGHLEYDLVLAPGSDPGAVNIALNGAEQVRLDESGDLCLETHGSTLKLLKPVAYQPDAIGTHRQPVEVRYRLQAAGPGHSAVLSFRVGSYDRRQPLTIDPVLIAGGSIPGLFPAESIPYSYQDTVLTAMTLDAAGNIYVATQAAANDAPFGVLKFSPAGELLLNVSLGSAETVAQPGSIAVDRAGNIYLAGTASVGLPTTPGAFQPTALNAQCAFLTVVKADGSALLYSTYLGGTGQSSIVGLAVDAAGKAYVAGTAYGTDFPTTPGAYLTSSGVPYGTSEFVAKLDPAQTGTGSLVYSTYIAGTSGDNGDYSSGGSIAVDKSGSAYVAVTSSLGFPVTPGAYAFEGLDASGAYVTKLSPDGSALVYSAFLGPGSPGAIAIDGSGAVYVAGTVTSGEFPTTAGAYQANYPGGFAAKLSADGSSLLYSTFLSGPSGNSYNTRPTAIALQANCASACVALISGTVSSPDWPLSNAIQSFQDRFPPPQNDASFTTGFLVGLSSDGRSALLSSYLGAAMTPTTSVGGLSVDSANNIYFAANVRGPDAPVTLPAPQDAGAGYILKIGLANAASAIALPGSFAVAAPQAVHSTTKTVAAIQLRNMGSQSIKLERPFVSSSKEFVESDGCGSTLAGGGICLIDISFTPSASGARTGTLTIASSAPNSPTVVSLSGSGMDEPELVLSTALLDFPDQVVDASSAPQTVTLTNTGDRTQSIVGITSTLPDFKITGNCPAQLPAQAACVLNVAFSPTQVGLRVGTLFVQLPGSSTANGYTYPNGASIALNGTGVLSTAGTGTLVLSAGTLNFGSVVVGGSAPSQGIAVLNTGNVPVTINSVGVTPGDFLVQQNSQGYGYECGSSAEYGSPNIFPYQIAPQGFCTIYVYYDPSVAEQEIGTVTISSSAAGSPLTAALSGVGLQSVQALTVQPGNLAFPPQPVGDPSAAQTLTIMNGGQDSVLLDRAVTSGDFAVDELNTVTSCEGATLGPLSSCQLSLVFNPTAVGARTGTLTLTDTLSGKPQVFNLTGTAVQATGAVVLSTTALSFPTQATGTTSGDQELQVTNPGNSPVTINSITFTGDFAQDRPFGQSCVGALAPGASCTVSVLFSPTKSSGTESGMLALHSTAGTLNVTLSGTAQAADEAIQITASSLSFGSVMVGTSGVTSGPLPAYLANTGNVPVTFLAQPVITAKVAAQASDFTFYGCYPYAPSSPGPSNYPLPPGQSCPFSVIFAPSQAGKESATLTFTDAGGAHTVALSGTGVTTAPAASLAPATLDFDQTVIGAAPSIFFNGGNPITFTNNGTQPITVASVTVTAGSSDFAINSQVYPCTGLTVYPGSSCTSYVLFAPSVAGYRTGALTVVDGNGVNYVAPLAGYALKEVNRSSLLPEALLLPSVSLESALTPSYGNNQSIQLLNTGNAAFTVGQISGTNISATGDFSISYPGGQDNCSLFTVEPGGSCQVIVAFTPKAVGTRTGTLVFPVTYADKSTASTTATISGVALANQDAAYLLPQIIDFSSTVVGGQSGFYPTQLTLTNSGTVALTPGVLSGTNLNLGGGAGDFTLGYNSCSGQTIAPGAVCTIGITFSPAAEGQRSGTVTVPVTYADGPTGQFTATFSGDSLVPAPALLVTPTSLGFNVEVAGTTNLGNTETTVLTSAGNVPVTITSLTASANFTVIPSGCGTSISLSPCAQTVAFTPLASTPPGPVSGTLTIVDNAPGSPHVVSLAGTVVSAAQQLAVSQTSVRFGSQTVNSTSAPQVIYLTDLGDPGSIAQVNSIQLGGPDAGDFLETQSCGGSLGFSIYGRQSCTISLSFAPGAHSIGTRTASVTIVPATGAPIVIQLLGYAAASPGSEAVRRP